MSYDLFDHLTQWYVSSTNQEQYLYDASGERVVRRSTNTSGTTLTVYAFGLEDHQYSGGGTNQANTYYYTVAGRMLGALDSNGTTFYLTDTLGSVLLSFTNTAGSASIKAGQVFGPYGNARYHAGTFNTSKGFTGQYNDGLTGLDYFNARYYDPVVGIFLSVDSVQGNPAGANPYAYEGGNPETYADPSGHMRIWFTGGAGDGGNSNALANIGTKYRSPYTPSVVGGFGGPSISGYHPRATSGSSVTQDTCSQMGCLVWARLRTGSIQVATAAQTTMCMYGACFEVPALTSHWVDTETNVCLATGPYLCSNEGSSSDTGEGDRDKDLGGVADGGIMAADAGGGSAGGGGGSGNSPDESGTGTRPTGPGLTPTELGRARVEYAKSQMPRLFPKAGALIPELEGAKIMTDLGSTDVDLEYENAIFSVGGVGKNFKLNELARELSRLQIYANWENKFLAFLYDDSGGPASEQLLNLLSGRNVPIITFTLP